METTSEHLKMLRKKWAKNVGLKGTEWKQFASFQKSLLCRDTTGTAVTEQEVEAVLHNRPLVRSSLQCLTNEIELTPLGSRKSIDVEMGEP